MKFPKIPTLETLSLQGWIIASSAIMAALLLLTIFSFAFLNQNIYDLNEKVLDINYAPQDENKSEGLDNYNRNLMMLWMATLDDETYNAFESADDTLGLCWVFPIQSKIETLRITVSSKWLGIEYPEGFNLTFSKTGEPLQCYFLKMEDPTAKVWEYVSECASLCDGLDFVDHDALIETAGEVDDVNENTTPI